MARYAAFLRAINLYWICRSRQMESKFSNAAFERKLKTRATFRGLKTMEKLAVKFPPTG